MMSAARTFGFETGALASLSKLPIGGGVFADEGEFGIERDFTLAKGIRLRHRVIGITDRLRTRVVVNFSGKLHEGRPYCCA